MPRWIRESCARRPVTFRPTLEKLEDRSLPSANSFFQTNLVSDVPGIARKTDRHLVNPWGLAASSAGAFWVGDNGTGVSTVYDSRGKTALPAVTVPPPAGSPAGTTSTPTGVVFDG